MTVSIVANGFLRNIPIFCLGKPAESSTMRAAPSTLHLNRDKRPDVYSVQIIKTRKFNGQTFSDAQAQSLIGQGQALLNQANALPH